MMITGNKFADVGKKCTEQNCIFSDPHGNM